MLIVPVLDIMDGQVVRGVAGDRARYRPIETPLAPGVSDPVALAQAITDLYGTLPYLYVADLDGIMKGRSDDATLAALAEAMPTTRLLVDSGFRTAETVGAVCKPNFIAVVGTETFVDPSEIDELAFLDSRSYALSLDQLNKDRLGSAHWFERTEIWPMTVIVMSLDRVGMGQGPDLERLQEIRPAAGRVRTVLAAGGVRDLDDLRSIGRMGCGALVASIIHSEALTSEAWVKLQQI